MSGFSGKLREIYSLEQLSGGTSPIHRIHPGVKLAVTFIYIVTVVSFDRYALTDLAPYALYPALLAALSDTPAAMVAKRAALTLPFVLLAGVSALIFDRGTAFYVGSLAVSYGSLSFLTLLVRSFLCVAAVLILVSVTPLRALTAALRRAHIPGALVTMFEMTYRYISVLVEEASGMYIAYMLRSTEHKGIQLRHMGSFLGQLLLGSIDRAERVYAAMKCRGYGAANPTGGKGAPLIGRDWTFLLLTVLPCLFFRAVRLSVIFERLFGR